MSVFDHVKACPCGEAPILCNEAGRVFFECCQARQCMGPMVQTDTGAKRQKVTGPSVPQDEGAGIRAAVKWNAVTGTDSRQLERRQ